MDEKEVLPYMEYSRLDLLCGFPMSYPHFPCEICGSLKCRGDDEPCKEHGAYSLGLTSL